MSLLDGLTYESTPDEVAAALVEEMKRRNYSFEEAVGVVADAKQESGLRMIWHKNRKWFGYFQQDTSYPDRESPKGNVLGFLDRLDVKRVHAKHGDIWANIFWLQQGPNWPSASHALAVGRIGYLHEIKAQEQWARNKVTSLWGAPVPPKTVDTVTPIVGAPIAVTPPKVTPMPQVGDPKWMFDVLKADGQIDVRALDGWLDSGHGDFKDIRGVMWHHTGNDRETAESIRRGRSDLPGPLSNLHIAKDGKVTVVAAGVCWHGGTGSYPFLPANMANWHMIGIECAWPPVVNGRYDEKAPWPRAQVLAMRNVAAALSRKMGLGVDRHIDHKEWAGRAQGKWDRGNMSPEWFRGEVAKDLAGFQFPGEGTVDVTPAPVPPPVPPVDKYANVLLYRGIVGHTDQVRALQTRLKRNYSALVVDGDFGPHTERCVRDFQLTRRPPLAGDGIVGPATAAALQLTL